MTETRTEGQRAPPPRRMTAAVERQPLEGVRLSGPADLCRAKISVGAVAA
jgi:hypothetical protein